MGKDPKKNEMKENVYMKHQKTILIVLTIVLVVILAGCAMVPQQRLPDRRPDIRIAETRTRSVDLPPVIVRPLIADLQVGPVKVTGTAEAPLITADVHNLRRLAVVNALENSNADILIEPIYDTLIRHRYLHEDGKVTVKVTGFPATYRNFRHSTESDLGWMENNLQLQLQQQEILLMQQEYQQGQREQLPQLNRQTVVHQAPEREAQPQPKKRKFLGLFR
jgi:hypothetical protein